jgi:hypothetical protein
MTSSAPIRLTSFATLESKETPASAIEGTTHRGGERAEDSTQDGRDGDGVTEGAQMVEKREKRGKEERRNG